jgi:hypothetical protein
MVAASLIVRRFDVRPVAQGVFTLFNRVTDDSDNFACPDLFSISRACAGAQTRRRPAMLRRFPVEQAGERLAHKRVFGLDCDLFFALLAIERGIGFVLHVLLDSATRWRFNETMSIRDVVILGQATRLAAR